MTWHISCLQGKNTFYTKVESIFRMLNSKIKIMNAMWKTHNLYKVECIFKMLNNIIKIMNHSMQCGKPTFYTKLNVFLKC